MSAGRRSRALSGVLTALVGLALVAAMAATAPDLKAAVRSWQH